MSGFEVPDTTRVLVSLQDYINHEDFFNQKLLCPIMIVYLEPDWKMACHKCMSLLSELKMGHTLTIHSKDWEVIREFALVKEVGRMVVNSPTACVATGVTVSYTHLDVYKRQVSIILYFVTNFISLLQCSGFTKKLERIFSSCSSICSRDVYKRQL